MRYVAAAAFLALIAPVGAQEGAMMAPVPQIVVSANSETRVSPDRATIHISVQTRAPTAAAAVAENATRQRAVLIALRRLGLDSAQLSTAGYNVHPEQRYEPNREPVIVGYVATNTIIADVRRLDRVGPVIDAAISSGANMIAGLQFFASNIETARRSAMTAAIQKARADADVAARAAGGTLGNLLELTIGGYHSPPPPRPLMTREMAAASAPDTPINPGEQAVTVDVTTRWRFIPAP